MQMIPKHIFWPIIDSSSLYSPVYKYTWSRCCYMPNRWAWSLPVTWQRWQSNHSIHHCRKPHAICKLHGCILYTTGFFADWSFRPILREKGILRIFVKK